MQEKGMQRGFWLVTTLAIAAIIAVTVFAGFIIDYLWFRSLNYTSVFWTLKLTRFWYWLFFSLIGFLALGVNFLFAYRTAKNELPPVVNGGALANFEFGEYTDAVKQLTAAGVQKLHLVVIIAAIVLGVFSGLSMAPHWDSFLKYFNGVPFGKTDPIFGHDIGFYVFSIPVYTLLRGWFMSLVVMSFLGSMVIYALSGMLKIADRSVSFAQKAKMHLYALVALGLLLKAWDYRLQMYDLLYAKGGVVFGAGYTDFYVHCVVLWAMLLYMLLLAVAVVASLFSQKDRIAWVVVAILITFPLAILLQGVLPGLVQQMLVKPNELVKEIPFIEHNIAMTNEAYGLTDIGVKAFPADNSMTLADLDRNQDTLDNIRLWDQRPLLSTYQQIQSIRTYYTFYNVDIDRYHIHGKVRQVMLAPRELEREKLPSQAQTWVNTRLTFTHGYGVVMNPVNSVTPEGMPELFIKDIPPVNVIDLPLTNTSIYFGEQPSPQTVSNQATSPNRSIATGNADYVIVRTENPEFDYPSGDQNKYSTYAGKGGIWMGSLFRRLLFAWGFRDVNILLTSSTTAESRIMFRRNIQDRIQHLAPFLDLDGDPYIVLSEGRVFWMVDAYVVSDQYPYATPVYYKGRPVNYIRNAFKVVVDAYDGSVNFYLMNPTEPLGRTYQKMFPGLFQDVADMPADLKAHIRYPHDLFYIQMLQYNTYHMKDPKVFYNKEDLWMIPKENYAGETVAMDPYYIQMQLPGETAQEFILMMPLTPNNKDNMVAWLAARCDGEHYGELIVYKFPKEKLVYGPLQIEARIDQSPNISQLFSLWDQRGSKVIRGNLLVIPIENSILYVEPVYLKSDQRDLPELKRVIASYSGEVVMSETLEDALAKVFGSKLRPEEQKLVAQVPAAALTEGELGPVIQQLADHFTAARLGLAEGNWLKYGEEMNQAEALIQQLQQQYAPQQ